jgi:hypothetical protein
MPERVFVDRIEGERAVLQPCEDGRESITLPPRLLTDGAREGAALDLTLAPAPEDTTNAEVQALMDDLFEKS